MARRGADDFSFADIAVGRSPSPRRRRSSCVGVNYPDGNEEYKDGQGAPANPSLFVRFPRSFVGHEEPIVRPLASEQLDYEARW